MKVSTKFTILHNLSKLENLQTGNTLSQFTEIDLEVDKKLQSLLNRGTVN